MAALGYRRRHPGAIAENARQRAPVKPGARVAEADTHADHQAKPTFGIGKIVFPYEVEAVSDLGRSGSIDALVAVGSRAGRHR